MILFPAVFTIKCDARLGAEGNRYTGSIRLTTANRSCDTRDTTLIACSPITQRTAAPRRAEPLRQRSGRRRRRIIIVPLTKPTWALINWRA